MSGKKSVAQIDSRFRNVSLRRDVGSNLPEMISGLVTRSAQADLVELIANSYDADSENVELTSNFDNDIFEITDDGCGMNPRDLISFYRLGDSIKLNEKLSSKKKRRRLGHFGVATIVLKSLARRYSLTTWKEGLETKVNEDLEMPLTRDRKIPFETSRCPIEKHGTRIVLKGLKFREGEGGFSIKNLKQRIQLEFRKLTTLPDFSVYVNGEQIKPSLIQNSVKFKVDEKGRYVGPVAGTIYLTNVRTEMSGIHVMVHGRTIGQPSSLLERVTDKYALIGKVVAEIEANGLAGAVLLDRGVFREDDRAFNEFLEIMKKNVAQVRNYQETQITIDAISQIKKARTSMAKKTLSKLAGMKIPGINFSTRIEFEDSPEENGAIPCYYDSKKNTLFFSCGAGPLQISAFTKRQIYEQELLNAAVEALAIQETQRSSDENPLDVFLDYREKLRELLSSNQKSRLRQAEIHPQVIYNLNDLAGLSSLPLGVIRYMAQGNMFPAPDETVLGKDFIDAKKRTKGLVSLYEFLADSRLGTPQQLSFERYNRILAELGKSAEPFIKDLSSNAGKPCYFIEGTSSNEIRTLFTSRQLDGRSPEYNPLKGFNDFGARVLSIEDILKISGGLSLKDIRGVIQYSMAAGNPLNEHQIVYRNFITALQEKRANTS